MATPTIDPEWHSYDPEKHSNMDEYVNWYMTEVKYKASENDIIVFDKDLKKTSEDILEQVSTGKLDPDLGDPVIITTHLTEGSLQIKSFIWKLIEEVKGEFYLHLIPSTINMLTIEEEVKLPICEALVYKSGMRLGYEISKEVWNHVKKKFPHPQIHIVTLKKIWTQSEILYPFKQEDTEEPMDYENYFDSSILSFTAEEEEFLANQEPPKESLEKILMFEEFIENINDK